MYKGKYEFCGIIVLINSLYEYIHTMCANYKSDKDEDLIIEITNDDIENEIKLSNDSNKNDVYPKYYLEALAVYRKFLDYAYKQNVFLFHSSAFMIDDSCFILTAPSGTGKSTHAKYLKQVYNERFKIINDDKPLIKFDGKDYIVYGSPWNGKHHLDNNVNSKLKGIFVLYQAKENIIEKLNSSIALNYVYKQVHKPLDKEATKLILNLLIDMCNKIDVYLFGCTNSIDAAYTSKEIIDKNI